MSGPKDHSRNSPFLRKYSSGTIPLFSGTIHPQVCFQELLTHMNSPKMVWNQNAVEVIHSTCPRLQPDFQEFNLSLKALGKSWQKAAWTFSQQPRKQVAPRRFTGNPRTKWSFEWESMENHWTTHAIPAYMWEYVGIIQHIPHIPAYLITSLNSMEYSSIFQPCLMKPEISSYLRRYVSPSKKSAENPITCHLPPGCASKLRMSFPTTPSWQLVRRHLHGPKL